MVNHPPDVHALPNDLELHCYRCKGRGVERKALIYKEYTTPNGSTYARGWCRECLEEKGIGPLSGIATEKSGAVRRTGNRARPARTGSYVTIKLSGEIVHYMQGVDGGKGYPPHRAVVQTKEHGPVVVPVDAIQLN